MQQISSEKLGSVILSGRIRLFLVGFDPDPVNLNLDPVALSPDPQF